MDVALLDAELAKMFALMYDMRDSLPDDYPEQFERRLQESLLDPVSFRYPFNALIDAGMNVVSSDDGRVRIFYWLHPGTGSHWRIPTILQVSTSEGIIVHNTRSLDTTDEGFDYWEFDNTPDIAYQRLHTLTDSTYLAIGGGQAMASLPWISAVGLAVHDHSITLGFPLFQQSDGTLEEEVGLVLSWYWYHEGVGDVLYPSMQFDRSTRELSFPEMIPIASDTLWTEEPTGDTIRLRFNGRYFEPADGK